MPTAMRSAGSRRCGASACGSRPALSACSASPQALAVVARSLPDPAPLRPVAVEPGETRRAAGWRVRCAEVPHARERRFRTYAWRLAEGGAAVVYASDVARLEPPLARLARGADLLVVDGAMWRRRLFSHLTIDRDLPTLCAWPVGRILLTQIGRSAPAHATLAREVAALCPRAAPAWDGLRVPLGIFRGLAPRAPDAPGARARGGAPVPEAARPEPAPPVRVGTLPSRPSPPVRDRRARPTLHFGR